MARKNSAPDSDDIPAVSVIEVARVLGGFRRHSDIMSAIISGAIPAEKVGGRWLVTPRNFDRLKAERAARAAAIRAAS